VTKAKITREGSESMGRALAETLRRSPKSRPLEAEVVPVTIKGRKDRDLFNRDEAPRPTTIETLAKLRPAFRPDGSITAGNAPRLNSGASAMLVANSAFTEANGIVPLARLVFFDVAAVEPAFFGLRPIPAVRRVLERASWQRCDIERIEINEAFAAIPLVVAQELGLREDIINVEGGAIAYGHPIGATGAALTTRLLHSMRRDGL
jgi:acetyl-CoA C-acetyltransferase